MSIPDTWRNRHTDSDTNPKYRKILKCCDCSKLVTNFNSTRCATCAHQHAMAAKRQRGLVHSAQKRDRRLDRDAARIAAVLGLDVTDKVRELATMVAFRKRGAE